LGRSGQTDSPIVTINGPMQDGAGVLSVTNYASSGTILFTGSNNQNRVLVLTGKNAGLNTMAPLFGANGTGTIAITKNGSGTWALTNTYTGTTTVNAGTLAAPTVADAAMASPTFVKPQVVIDPPSPGDGSFSPSVVPEPGTLALLAASGAISAAAWLRRRQSNCPLVPRGR